MINQVAAKIPLHNSMSYNAPLYLYASDAKYKSTDKIDVRLDYENLHIGIEKLLGHALSPQALIEVVKRSVEDLGEVVNIVAYADWDLLSRDSDYSIQRELARIGVDTRYQLNIWGKNSADMRLADDIRTLLDRGSDEPDAVDTIVLGTCDRDFRPIIQTAKSRDRKLILLSLKDSISQYLKIVARENLRYLDQYILIQAITKLPLNIPKSWEPHVTLIAKIMLALQQRGRTWIYRSELEEHLRREPQALISVDALTKGIAIFHARESFGSVDILELNQKHPLVQAVRCMIDWLPQKIEESLQKMSYVDSNYLAIGMQREKTFKRLKVGQNRNEAEVWLRIMENIGLVYSKERPHPKTPSNIISTWWISENPRDSRNQPGLFPHLSEITFYQGQTRPRPAA